MSRTFWTTARRSGVGLLAASALVLAPTLTAPVVAANSDSRPPQVTAARPALQPQRVGSSTLTKRQARPTLAPATAAPEDTVTAYCGAVSIAGGTAPSNYISLDAFGYSPIPDVADDSITTFSVPAFRYAGATYTRLAVGSNGYVQVGDVPATVSLHNQELPDTTPPNSTLAAFWTDLNPGFAGEMRIGTITDTADTWIVVDWKAVREFSTPGNTHSFEIWIGVDGDAHPGMDVSYVYGSNTGNGDGGFLTVGAENQDGTTGAVAYFSDGVLPPSGTLPTSGTALRVGYDGKPVASFSATPSAGLAPLSVAFDGTLSSDDGSISTYAWEFGDGTTGSGATTSHTYAAGVHTATLTVTDNDTKTCAASQPVEVTGGFSVNNVRVNEAAGTATFTVTRPDGPAASVDVTTLAGTARTPADFTAGPSTLHFASGVTSQPFTVTIKQDALDEPDEHYRVRLSNPVGGSLTDATGLGTIVDDDPAARLSVSDDNLVEGNTGTKNLVFKVSLNRRSGKTVKVTLHTADGSATAPADYTSKTVTLTFSPGQTVKSVPVAVKGDSRREPNETLVVLLNHPFHAVIRDANGTGGIIDND